MVDIRMVASQLPFAVVLPKALKNSCFAAVFGFFITRRLYESKLSSAPRNKKTRTVRAGFVTPSGFKPETF